MQSKLVINYIKKFVTRKLVNNLNVILNIIWFTPIDVGIYKIHNIPYFQYIKNCKQVATFFLEIIPFHVNISLRILFLVYVGFWVG